MERRTRYGFIVCLVVAGFASQIQACAAEAPTASSDAPLSEVRFVAAFAPVQAVTLYDRDGYVLDELEGVDGDLTAMLEDGVYFADIRDDYGNSVFDANERMLFAPRIEGAELHLEPYAIPGSEVPLVGIVVGDRTRFDEHTHDVAVSMEALHTNGPDHRGRMVWEAARAMVGPSLAGTHTWGTSAANSTHNYVGEDSGAWSSLRTAYSAYNNAVPSVWTVGFELSCRNDADDANQYSPCSLTYGSDVVNIYSCQGYCPAGVYRGGQCKAFMNLVAYRSGVYHGASWAFVRFASDSTIDDGGTSYPLATSATITVGDLLRRPTSVGTPHAAIAVRVISASQIVVVDSNWSNGSETVTSHTLGFSGTGTVSDLGTYHRLSCVYAGTC